MSLGTRTSIVKTGSIYGVFYVEKVIDFLLYVYFPISRIYIYSEVNIKQIMQI